MVETTFRPRDITPMPKGETAEEMLLSSVKFRDAGATAAAILEVMRKDPSFTFQDAELIFRKNKTLIYVLAWPLSGQGVARFVHSGEPSKYALWLSVNGLREALISMNAFTGSCYDENFELLKETGVCFQE